MFRGDVFLALVVIDVLNYYSTNFSVIIVDIQISFVYNISVIILDIQMWFVQHLAVINIDIQVYLLLLVVDDVLNYSITCCLLLIMCRIIPSHVVSCWWCVELFYHLLLVVDDVLNYSVIIYQMFMIKYYNNKWKDNSTHH